MMTMRGVSSSQRVCSPSNLALARDAEHKLKWSCCVDGSAAESRQVTKGVMLPQMSFKV